MFREAPDSRAAEIFEKLRPQLVKYIQTIVNPADAEDILQESFIIFVEHARLNKVRRGEEQAWLYRVAHNKAIDNLRKNKRIQLETDSQPEVFLSLVAPQASETEKLMQAILRRVRTLAINYTKDGTGLLLLHMIEENRDRQEIARAMKISDRHLRRKVAAFFKYLQTELEKEGYKNPFGK